MSNVNYYRDLYMNRFYNPANEYVRDEYVRVAREINFKPKEKEAEKTLQVNIKEYTSSKHVARKTKEACQGYCEWHKK